ncbi:hypothetical protein YC2023_020212 [Brassica napus]
MYKREIEIEIETVEMAQRRRRDDVLSEKLTDCQQFRCGYVTSFWTESYAKKHENDRNDLTIMLSTLKLLIKSSKRHSGGRRRVSTRRSPPQSLPCPVSPSHDSTFPLPPCFIYSGFRQVAAGSGDQTGV